MVSRIISIGIESDENDRGEYPFCILIDGSYTDFCCSERSLYRDLRSSIEYAIFNGEAVVFEEQTERDEHYYNYHEEHYEDDWDEDDEDCDCD